MDEMNTKERNIKDLVYVIRGQQVMLDSDLAKFYGTEVKKLNQQVKRNKEKFPQDFMFQLTKSEVDDLRSQNVSANISTMTRNYSYVFSEQGVYMLATILKNDFATKQSILIMRTFKEMRHYINENQSLLNSTDLLKLSTTLIQYEQEINDIKDTIDNNLATKSDIDKIMDNFIDEDKIKEITILNGRKFDAIEAYKYIYMQATKSIYIINDYVNIETLSLLKCKNEKVKVLIFTDNKGQGNHHLEEKEIQAFNLQYPSLSIKRNKGISHDRYIILDYCTNHEIIYHCGASSKDAGKKVSSINRIFDTKYIHIMIEELFSNY